MVNSAHLRSLATDFLEKATGLGARSEEAQISLELIDNLVRALRSDPVDELHLANRYASLLETHVKAFRRILRVTRSRDPVSREPRQTIDANGNLAMCDQQSERIAQFPMQNQTEDMEGQNLSQMMTDTNDTFNGNDIHQWADGMGNANGSFMDEWMCLPLDAFDPGILEFNSSLGARGLDFFSM